LHRKKYGLAMSNRKRWSIGILINDSIINTIA